MRTLFLLLWIFMSLPVWGQQIYVEDFAKVKNYGVKNKQSAVLDLYTSEKGFVFTIGDVPIESKEEDGFIRLLVPHKATYLKIQHPDYGQLAWKAPIKAFKKKKRYKAYLRTESIEKEFKLPKQWAIFHIEPKHAILYIDSTMHTTESGELAFFLPIGKHPCKIVSPFYSALTDTIEVIDSTRLEKMYTLSPYFSFLTVETTHPEACIRLNNKEVGRGVAHTNRLQPGRYLLDVTIGNQLCYRREIKIDNAEKKVIRITDMELTPIVDGRNSERLDTLNRELLQNDLKTQTVEFSQQIDDNGMNSSLSTVSIKALDEETEIWINREKMANGSWEGQLAPGFYSLSSHKQGYDSKTFYFWVESGKDLELNLKSPLADYGMLNVSCDHINAHVFLNGVLVGKTPCVIQNLPAYESYRLDILKGDKRAEQLVKIKANDIVSVKIFLK